MKRPDWQQRIFNEVRHPVEDEHTYVLLYWKGNIKVALLRTLGKKTCSVSFPVNPHYDKMDTSKALPGDPGRPKLVLRAGLLAVFVDDRGSQTLYEWEYAQMRLFIRYGRRLERQRKFAE